MDCSYYAQLAYWRKYSIRKLTKIKIVMNKQERKQKLKQKLKEKRCRMHIIHTCEKHGIGYQMYESGNFWVTYYDHAERGFKFREEAGMVWNQSIFELREKLDNFIKQGK